MKTLITFGMLVKVISGFYAGCTGMVVGHKEANSFDVEKYIVDAQCHMATGRTERVEVEAQAKELKEIK